MTAGLSKARGVMEQDFHCWRVEKFHSPLLLQIMERDRALTRKIMKNKMRLAGSDFLIWVCTDCVVTYFDIERWLGELTEMIFLSEQAHRGGINPQISSPWITVVLKVINILNWCDRGAISTRESDDLCIRSLYKQWGILFQDRFLNTQATLPKSHCNNPGMIVYYELIWSVTLAFCVAIKVLWLPGNSMLLILSGVF